MSFIPDAFLIHEGVCYTPSTSSREEDGHFIAYDSPGETPVTRLIEGICSQFPQQSRAILRERIFSKYPLTPACEGMIKVVAKRASFLPEIEYGDAFLKASVDGSRIEVSQAQVFNFKSIPAPKRFSSEKEAASFALRLKPKPAPDAFTKPVACVLYSESGETLAHAWNTNAQNRAQHAELNLIRALKNFGLAKIPANATLVVTLKPCAMCAAQIFSAAAEISSLAIFYIEDDLGPKAQNSVLIQNSSLWTKAGEPEIRLAQLNVSF